MNDEPDLQPEQQSGPKLDELEIEILGQIRAWRKYWDKHSGSDGHRVRMDEAQSAIIKLIKKYIEYRQVKLL